MLLMSSRLDVCDRERESGLDTNLLSAYETMTHCITGDADKKPQQHKVPVYT